MANFIDFHNNTITIYGSSVSLNVSEDEYNELFDSVEKEKIELRNNAAIYIMEDSEICGLPASISIAFRDREMVGAMVYITIPSDCPLPQDLENFCYTIDENFAEKLRDKEGAVVEFDFLPYCFVSEYKEKSHVLSFKVMTKTAFAASVHLDMLEGVSGEERDQMIKNLPEEIQEEVKRRYAE